MIRGAQNPGGPITTNYPADTRDHRSRQSDLRTVDKKAVISASPGTPADTYQFRLEVKSTGTNTVKGLIWEFQPAAGPDDYQSKQYLCALQVPPNEKKVLDVWTPYIPMKVISADKSKDPLKGGTVVINQIEYVDGSIWKKRGWNYRLPVGSLAKLSEGTCSVF